MYLAIGDSRVIIYWELEKAQVLSLKLFHWLKDSRRLMSEFNSCSFYHIFRELNADADILSKTSLGELDDRIHLSIFVDGPCQHRETVFFDR